MNKTFNLVDFLSQKDADSNEIAALLFPNNDHPVPALQRLISGKSKLTVTQLELIADKYGMSVPDLYSQDTKIFASCDTIKIKGSGYEATLNRENWTLQIVGSGVNDVIIVDKNISVRELIEVIEKIFKK